MKKITSLGILFLKGFCMGIADIIPGVSGGTIAFLTGIYPELIESISSFNQKFLQAIVKGRIRFAFSQTGWKFLIVLLSGILSALFLLAHPLLWLLENYPPFVYAFFFGLILTTVFIILKKIREKSFIKIFCAFMSALIMFLIAGVLPAQTPESWWFLFLSGAVAICAMILPGISGAFILLLLGKYEFLVQALSNRDFGVLFVVAAGCITGLMTFVRLLKWLLDRHRDLTMSVLAGLVFGSLRKIWPWKEMVQDQTGANETAATFYSVNVIPKTLTPEIFVAILLLIVGIFVGIWLGRTGETRKKGFMTLLKDGFLKLS